MNSPTRLPRKLSNLTIPFSITMDRLAKSKHCSRTTHFTPTTTTSSSANVTCWRKGKQATCSCRKRRSSMMSMNLTNVTKHLKGKSRNWRKRIFWGSSKLSEKQLMAFYGIGRSSLPSSTTHLLTYTARSPTERLKKYLSIFNNLRTSWFPPFEATRQFRMLASK